MNARTMIGALILGPLLTITPIATAEAETCQNSFACGLASDNPFEVTGASILLTGIGFLTSIPATSNATSETFNYYFKKSAQNDAAAFIASDGEIRGAFFESELKAFNAQRPDSNLDDRGFALLLLGSRPLL